MDRRIPQLAEPTQRPRSIIPPQNPLKRRYGADHISGSTTMTQRPLLIPLGLKRLKVDVNWDSFDHDKDAFLGFRRSKRIVYHKTEPVVLHSCEVSQLTQDRQEFVEIVQSIQEFASMRCQFNHEGRLYIGSNLFEVSLADIILYLKNTEETFSESVIKTIIYHVVSGIESLHKGSSTSKPFSYGSLNASHVFFAITGEVQLSIFGHDIKCSSLTPQTAKKDLEHIGYLIGHMLCKFDQPILDIQTAQPSLELLEFHTQCFNRTSISSLSQHIYLQGEDKKSQKKPQLSQLDLIELIVLTARNVGRPCFRAKGKLV